MNPYLINKAELFRIISDAKQHMATKALPISVSGKVVDQSELPTIAIIESVLTFLNSKKLLTNQVDLDYTVNK